MIKKLAFYDLSAIITAAGIEVMAFQELRKKPDGLEIVKRFRSEAETLLQNLDQRWVTLCDGDPQELTDWANRMLFIRGKLNELDHQLAISNKPHLFRWDTVLFVMGLVNAFRVAAELMIDYNSPLPK